MILGDMEEKDKGEEEKEEKSIEKELVWSGLVRFRSFFFLLCVYLLTRLLISHLHGDMRMNW